MLLNNITNLTTTTIHTPTEPIAPIWGYLSLVVAVVFFGSNYLPVKQYETGDGMFFQLILCLAIWTIGFVVNWIRNFPKFYALPMLGGVLWATGNVNTVPIIKSIGIGLGMLFWGTVSLIIGWANARFGWFGVQPERPTRVNMNYVSVALAALSTVFYLFIKSDTTVQSENAPQSPTINDDEITETQPLIDEIHNVNGSDRQVPPVVHLANRAGLLERLNPNVKRVIGTILAVTSGVLYGVVFTPYLYVRDNPDKYPDASQNGLDYVFSLYTGILVTSVVYFSIYCVVKKNRPVVNARAIFPGLISGWMWGIANCAFFIANTALSQAVAFPIVASGPPVIASLWGIFLYKEVKGARNFVILIVGFSCAITGSILCGLSK